MLRFDRHEKKYSVLQDTFCDSRFCTICNGVRVVYSSNCRERVSLPAIPKKGPGTEVVIKFIVSALTTLILC